jgi:hypothetical protein
LSSISTAIKSVCRETRQDVNIDSGQNPRPKIFIKNYMSDRITVGFKSGTGSSRISDWLHHCHPQGYTQAEDNVIEQACANQMSVTRRIPSQPAHPL